MPRSGLETACTGIPAASSCSTTPFQLELSAKAPWTSATAVVSGMGSLRGGERGQRLADLDDVGGEHVSFVRADVPGVVGRARRDEETVPGPQGERGPPMDG